MKAIHPDDSAWIKNRTAEHLAALRELRQAQGCCDGLMRPFQAEDRDSPAGLVMGNWVRCTECGREYHTIRDPYPLADCGALLPFGGGVPTA